MKAHFFLYLMLLAMLYACNASQGESTKNSQKTTIIEETQALLVLTGFGSEKENISLKELKEQYCEGKIYILERIEPKVKEILGCNSSKVLKKISDFAPLAKENILIADLQSTSPQFKAIAVDNIDFFKNTSKYPLYLLGTNKESFDASKQLTSLTLTGTTALTRYMGKATDQNGTDWLIENILPAVKGSDFLHISNEVSAMDNCLYVPGMRFCMKTAHLETFKKLGVNIVELTGNHNLDYGKDAYIKTYEWYQAGGMKIFGGGLSPQQAYEPLILPLKDGSKVAMIGFNESCPVNECAGRRGNQVGAAPYDSLKVKESLEKLKQNKEISYIIASVQFNETDSYAPTKSQAKITKYLIDWGADFVYGSQAHQVQQVEFYKGKPIFHGFGNFLFDQIHRVGVRQGFFLHTYFYKGKIVQTLPVFTFTATERRPALANTEQIKEIKKAIFLDRNLYAPY